jgi:hypothetical protein
MELVLRKGNKIAYMARCIWITCQIHRVMQEFVESSLKYNPTILLALSVF